MIVGEKEQLESRDLAIDGYRGILIFLLVAGHFRLFITGYYHFEATDYFFSLGHLSVPCFFLISGLLIYRSLMRKFSI